MNTNNPVGASVVVSATVKAVLIALAALGWVPVDDDAIGYVTLAVAAVVDLLLYFGLIKPHVNQLQAQAEQTDQGGTAPRLAAPPQPRGTTFRSDRDLR